MKLMWARLALADRRHIRELIAVDNPDAAFHLDALFAKKAGMLADHPELGRSGRVKGTRELVVHHHYILVYDISGSTVRLLRVLHSLRQWPPAR